MRPVSAPAPAIMPGAPRPLSTPSRLLVAALIANAALNVFLEVVVTVEERRPLLPGILLIIGGDLLLAAIVTRLRRPRAALAAAAFLLLMMAGTVPHDLPEVLHPTGAVRLIFSLLSLLVPVAGIAAGLWALRTAAPAGRGQ